MPCRSREAAASATAAVPLAVVTVLSKQAEHAGVLDDVFDIRHFADPIGGAHGSDNSDKRKSHCATDQIDLARQVFVAHHLL
jgi:hypothetical protein